MKSIYFLLLALILIPIVSAAEWDNVKAYNSTTKTITISNAFDFPLIGTEIAKVQLDTEINQQVGLGYQKVFEYTIDSYVDYPTFIKEMEIYNLKVGSVKESKSIDLKYKVITQELVIDYEIKCKEDVGVYSEEDFKKYGCERIEIGKHYEDRISWLPLEKLDMKIEKLTISGWTNVQQGDYYEWVPEFAGIKVSEWATWTGNLSTGITSVYKFEETSGTVTYDTIGRTNLTNSGVAINQNGILNKAYLFDTNSDKLLSGAYGAFGGNTFTTINIWVNITSTNTLDRILNLRNAAVTRDYNLQFTDGSLSLNCYDGTSFNTGSIDYTAYLNKWTMITIADNGTYNMYLDGVLKTSSTQNMAFADSVLTLGQDSGSTTRAMNGLMDEVIFWNRTLTATEILLLYKDGVGCSYGDETCYTPPASPCLFKGYVKDSVGTGLNLANISIFNQYNITEKYNTTTNSSGYWEVNISNSTNTYFATAVYNLTLVGGIKHSILGTC
jgi:hypothetical protein